MEEKPKTQIVTNTTDGYGYKYSSLTDIAKQGYRIPIMRIKPVTLGEKVVDYIEYFGEDGWCLGARIVVPEMKGMNAAQAYGSALTYARRYTVQMALGLACGDDEDLENKPQKKVAPIETKKATTQASDIVKYIRGAKDKQDLEIRKTKIGGWIKNDQVLKAYNEMDMKVI